MLQEEANDLGQEDFLPDLAKIHGAGKHLLELINAVLDISKIEAGKMDLYLETFERGEDGRGRGRDHPSAGAEERQPVRTLRRADDMGTMHADLTKVRQSLFNLAQQRVQVYTTTAKILGWTWSASTRRRASRRLDHLPCHRLAASA